MRTLVAALLIAGAAFAQAAQHTVTLAATDTKNPPGTQYNFYRLVGACPPQAPATTAGFTLLNTSPLATPSFTDSAVSAGQTYCYLATAVSGTISSSPSNDAPAVVSPFPPVLTVTVN